MWGYGVIGRSWWPSEELHGLETLMKIQGKVGERRAEQ